MLSQPERAPHPGLPGRVLGSSLFTALAVALCFFLSACSGGGGGSGSDSTEGDLEVGTLWPQKDSVPPGAFDTELPDAVASIRYVFRSNSGFSCCVVVDPDALSGNHATLQSLPEGPGTIQVSGYPTTFAGAPEGVSEICLVDPDIGRACSRNRLSSPSFDSGPRDVDIVGGDSTNAGDVQVRGVPFVLIPSLLPVPNSAVDNPIPVEFTVVDAIFGVDPDSVAAALLPVGGSRRNLNVVLRACTDGTAVPCSPNGQLNVRGFICNADNPQLVPLGATGLELSARNLAPTPGAMQFRYDFTAGGAGGSTPTPQRTATATVRVPTPPTIGSATRTPTPSRTATRGATFTPSVTRTPKVVSLAFVRAPAFNVSHEPSYVAVADFNRDGRDDVAVTSPESKEVNVLLGTADGTFTPGTVARFGTFPGWIVAGDLNGDQFVDLAVADERAGGVFLIYGGANGTFTAPALKLVGRRPFGVAIGNFDGVTGNDLAVTDRDANRVLILLNDGKPTPTFRNGGNAAVGSEPSDIVTGDFNNDGKPDLATLNNGGSAVKDVTLLLFDRIEGGLVIFTRAANLVVGDRPIDLSVATLNSDAGTDLIMLNRPANDGFAEVDSLLSRPGGVPIQSDPLVVHCPDRTVNCRARALAVGDFDNDGISDIALTLNQTGQGLDSDVLSVLLATGDGGFIPGPTLAAAGQPLAMGAGDLTGDGRDDVVVTSAQADSVQVYVNVGNQN